MIVVDVETTGLNEYKNSIVSIGALEFDHPRNQFYEECRIWDGAEIDQAALDINGFTKEEIINPAKQSLEEIMKKFILWAESITERTLAGENIGKFDYKFLEASANKYRLKWIFGHRTIDLHSEAYSNHLRRGLIPPAKNNYSDLNSNTIFIYTGLPSEPKPHNGLIGAKMEAEAFSRLMHGKGLLPDFSGFRIPDYLRRTK